jgi:preprotein translocase subunit SecE
VKKIISFFKDCYAELKRVVWPTREEVGASTKVVIFSTILIVIILGAVDIFFSWLVGIIF